MGEYCPPTVFAAQIPSRLNIKALFCLVKLNNFLKKFKN